MAALQIRPGDQVADIGAGEGYFVAYLSAAVGSTGRVFAADVDPEITEKLREKFPPATFPNVRVILAEPGEPLLPDGGVDLILLVNTYHHIEDRIGYFERLRADLSSGGRVAIIDPSQETTGILRLFLEVDHMTIPGDLVLEMKAAGYVRDASHNFLPVQLFEIFAPK